MKAREAAINETRDMVQNGIIRHCPAIWTHLSVCSECHTPEHWIYVDAEKNVYVFCTSKPEGIVKMLVDSGAIKVNVGEAKVSAIVQQIEFYHTDGKRCFVDRYGNVTPICP